MGKLLQGCSCLLNHSVGEALQKSDAAAIRLNDEGDPLDLNFPGIAPAVSHPVGLPDAL